MKKLLYTLLSFAFLLNAAGCTDEIAEANAVPKADADGNIAMQFTATLPAAVQVQTRAGELDQFDMETVYLYCFGEAGTFIGRSQAKFSIQEDGGAVGQNETYRFSAKVPQQTRVIHFVANWNDLNFVPSEHIAETEEQIMLGMQSYSGKIGYWGRAEVSPQTKADAAVTFIRNQAKVTVTKDAGVSDFEITGFAVFNAYDRGTVAPFDKNTHTFVTDAEKITECTLPEEYGKTTNPTEEGELTVTPSFVFENPNADNDPVYVIMKGRSSGEETDRFYKIMFQNGADVLKLLRNHHYQIILKKTPRTDLGAASVEEAMKSTMPALNNVWIAVSNDVTKISDNAYTLDIEKPVRVFQSLDEGKAVFGFRYYRTADGTYSEGTDTKPVVKWADAESEKTGTLDYRIAADGTAEVTITPHDGFSITNTVQSASIQIKAGMLSRIVKVLFVDFFQFTPVWASTNVTSELAGADVKFVFNIPDDFPDELMPLECKISANYLDPRDENPLNILIRNDDMDEKTWGEQFPKEGDLENVPDGWQSLPGAATQWEHKYLYVAREKGLQRVYFKTSIALKDHPEITRGIGHIYVEAENFKYVHQAYTVNKVDMVFLFPQEQSGQRLIFEYQDPHSTSGLVVQYMLVRPVSGFEYTLDFARPELDPGSSEDKEKKVRVYSEKQDVLSCNGQPVIAGPLYDEVSQARYYEVEANVGVNHLRMRTATPRLDGMIRLAAPEGDTQSAGLTIEAFSPFDFHGFRVNGHEVSQENASIGIGYEPGQEVELSFIVSNEERDATGSLSNEEEVPVWINPTSGGEFSCLLATENLKLVDDGGQEADTYTDALGGVWTKAAGGYRYVVKPFADSQSMETAARTVKFKTAKMVSAETIRFTADEAKVMFNPVAFSLKNEGGSGNVTYGDGQEGVPSGNALTVYARGNAVIGSLVVGATGRYTLKLNPGYTDRLGWNENVMVMYEPAGSAERYYWVGALSTLDGGDIQLERYES